MAFQSFFENILHKHDSSFLSVKPSGREGDWKCDGFSQNSGTIYQCYAPEEITNKEAAKKIKNDFNGAKVKWGAKMKRWVFVWSAYSALPPQTVSALQELKSLNSPPLLIEDWSREDLWKIVAKLNYLDRVGLLGPVPTIQAAAETTAAEIQTLLNYLVRQELELINDNLDLTDLSDKLTKNRLTETVQAMIRPSIPVAKMVEDYTKRHPDINFSEIVAGAMVDKYNRLVADDGVATEMVFMKLVYYVLQSQINSPKFFWAAVGIITHYFQLCDIFER